MIYWYLKSRRLLCSLHQKAVEALIYCEEDTPKAAKALIIYMKADFQQLQDHWHSIFPEETFGYLGRNINYSGEKQAFEDIIRDDIIAVEIKLDQHLAEFVKLHPECNPQPHVTDEQIVELQAIRNEKINPSDLFIVSRELNTTYGNAVNSTEDEVELIQLLRETTFYIKIVYNEAVSRPTNLKGESYTDEADWEIMKKAEDVMGKICQKLEADELIQLLRTAAYYVQIVYDKAWLKHNDQNSEFYMDESAWNIMCKAEDLMDRICQKLEADEL